jgi:hypothetical protein
MESCPICLENLAQDAQDNLSNITITPCVHRFHTNCLRRWQNSKYNGNHCPVCRNLLNYDDSDSDSGSDFDPVPNPQPTGNILTRIVALVSTSGYTTEVFIRNFIMPPALSDTPIVHRRVLDYSRSIASDRNSNRIMAHYSYCSRCDESTMAHLVCHGDEDCEAFSRATCRRNHPMVHKTVPYGTDPSQRVSAAGCLTM